MKTRASEALSELQEFVVYQAAEDAALPSVEQPRQAKIVADVLVLEAPNIETFKKLLKLYQTERRAA